MGDYNQLSYGVETVALRSFLPLSAISISQILADLPLRSFLDVYGIYRLVET